MTRPIVFVFGTRPEIIKCAPVVAALQARGIVPRVLLTGQHAELIDGTPLGACREVIPLGLKSDGNVTRWLQTAARELDKRLAAPKPALVVVQGDTMSAYAGAKAALRNSTPVAHIEAGVRSGDDTEPWPEEMLRCEISQIASWHFAATADAAANLRAEGIADDRIFVTGNPAISALAQYTSARPQPNPNNMLVITLHRRELTRDLERFRPVVGAIFDALRAYEECTGFWPVHPALMGMGLNATRPTPANLMFVPPARYVDFMETVAWARGVLTDSGGLVEECTALGVPCAVLRRVTDRPEAEAVGIARRFNPDPLGVAQAFEWLSAPHARQPHTVYGLPDAADRIAGHLAEIVQAE